MSESTEDVYGTYARRGQCKQEQTLVKREKNNEVQELEPASGLSLDDTLCNVILVSKTARGEREDMEAEGKRSLHETLEMNDLSVEDESELICCESPWSCLWPTPRSS